MRQRLVTLAIALAAASSSLSAQVVRRHSDFASRSSGGITFTQVRPLGGLADNIGFGYGGSGNYVFQLDKAGIAGLRLAGSISGYGQEKMRVPLSYTVGGRIQVDVTTTNTIGTLTIGPELMFPEGLIRPYAHGGMGVIWFNTTSSVNGIDNYDESFSTRNHSDATPTWTVGGGIHIPLARKQTAVLLDLGVDYFYGGDASYLRKGSIVDLPNGEIQINPLYSETRFLNVSFGLRITP